MTNLLYYSFKVRNSSTTKQLSLGLCQNVFVIVYFKQVLSKCWGSCRRSQRRPGSPPCCTSRSKPGESIIMIIHCRVLLGRNGRWMCGDTAWWQPPKPLRKSSFNVWFLPKVKCPRNFVNVLSTLTQPSLLPDTKWSLSGLNATQSTWKAIL